MALVTRGDDAPPVEKIAPARITEPAYKGITVDTKYIPSSSLLNSLEGSNWIVNYYSQVVDDDSYLNGQMINTEAVFQQYWLIKEFELKVTTSLTPSQNTDTKEMQLTGSAHVHPTLIPNVGDMFLADVGDGREGLFRITSSETRSIFKDTAHLVEYELVSYSTQLRRDDLNNKTVKILHYVKDNNYYGQNPLVEDEEFYLNRDLKIELRTLIRIYFDSFFSNEFQSLKLPGQINKIYDDFLVRTIKRMFNTDEHICIRHLRALNVSDDRTLLTHSLFDAILNRDKRFLLHMFRKSGLVSVKTFTKEPMMESINHSGFNYIVYPKDEQISIDYSLEYKKKTIDPTTSLIATDNMVADLDTLIDPLVKTKLPYGSNDLIYQVCVDDYYVLSENFYENTENQSKFELIVRDHVEGRPLNKYLLKALCQTYHAWGGLEKFYYLPILIMLIKSSVKEV